MSRTRNSGCAAPVPSRMAKLALAVAGVVLAAAPTAGAATVYRDAERGVEVRIEKRIATVSFAEPTCGSTSLRTRVRGGRFARSHTFACGTPTIGAGVPSRTVRVTGTVTANRVRGAVAGRRFLARRGAPPPTAVQRCSFRGATVAETELVRVFRDGDVTIACRRRDGAAIAIAETVHDADNYYSSGTGAYALRALGSRIAYASARFDSAASKYGEGDNPMFHPTIVVRDLETGAETRVAAELANVQAIALRDDGRVAWAGSMSSYYGGVVYVKTVQDGKVVTLDQGPIDPATLRVQGDGFAWDRS